MERAKLNLSMTDKIRNEEIRRRTKIEDSIKEIGTKKLRWAGYIARQMLRTKAREVEVELSPKMGRRQVETDLGQTYLGISITEFLDFQMDHRSSLRTVRGNCLPFLGEKKGDRYGDWVNLPIYYVLLSNLWPDTVSSFRYPWSVSRIIPMEKQNIVRMFRFSHRNTLLISKL